MTSRIEYSPIFPSSQPAEPNPLTLCQIQEMVSAVTAEQIQSIAQKIAENIFIRVTPQVPLGPLRVEMIWAGPEKYLQIAWDDHSFESHALRRNPIYNCKSGLSFIIADDLTKALSSKGSLFYPGYWLCLTDHEAHFESVKKNREIFPPFSMRYTIYLWANTELTQKERLVFTFTENIDDGEVHRESFTLNEL